MIVTEYMENGSLDAFLRVRAPPYLSHGLAVGVQSGCGVTMRGLQTSWSLAPTALGKGCQVQGPKGQPVKLPFSPITCESLCCTGSCCLAVAQGGVPLWGPRAPPRGEAWQL